MTPQELDLALALRISGETDASSVVRLDGSNKSIGKVAKLRALTQVRRLDLSHNQLDALGGIVRCTSLHWLNLSHNSLVDLAKISKLGHLQVLNVSHNKLAERLKVPDLPKLGALIANDNAITSLKGLGNLPELNTLVLKNNQLSSLGTVLSACQALSKLSLSHNQLTDLGDSLSSCSKLVELRLAHNLLSALPKSLSRNSCLRILELGNNPIKEVASIRVLRKLPELRNLTLRDCPVAEQPDFAKGLSILLPQLQVLNGQKLSIQTTPTAQPSQLLAGDKKGQEQHVKRQGKAETKKRKAPDAEPKAKRKKLSSSQEIGVQEQREGSASEAEDAGPKARKQKRKGSSKTDNAEALIWKGKGAAKRERKSGGEGPLSPAEVSEAPEGKHKTKKMSSHKQLPLQNSAPNFLAELMSGRLEADIPEAEVSEASDLFEGSKAAESLTSVDGIGREPGKKAMRLHAGMRGAQVAEALRLGLLNPEASLSLGQPSGWGV